MFSGSLENLKEEDLVEFTKEYAEGVRVEYKSDFGKAKLPRGVSSLANSFGGLFIIGTTADSKTNKVTNIDGIDNKPGIRERVIQSCLEGIYPPINPEVKLIELKNRNVVVVIRVVESPDAPHAIQNSTKIYIRVGEITDSNDFSKEADIKRIEYLLDRRKGFQEKKAKYIKLSEQRFSRMCSRALEKEGLPYLSLSAVPFSTISPALPLSKLEEFFNSLDINQDRATLSMIRDSQYGFNKAFDCIFRLDIPEENSASGWFHFTELNTLGQAFNKASLESSDQKEIYLQPIIGKVVTFLGLVRSFHSFSGTIGIVEISLGLYRISGFSLGRGSGIFPYRPRVSHDDYANSVFSGLIPPRKMSDNFVKIAVELMDPILWSFDFPIPDLEETVRKIAKDRGLID